MGLKFQKVKSEMWISVQRLTGLLTPKTQTSSLASLLKSPTRFFILDNSFASQYSKLLNLKGVCFSLQRKYNSSFGLLKMNFNLKQLNFQALQVLRGILSQGASKSTISLSLYFKNFCIYTLHIILCGQKRQKIELYGLSIKSLLFFSLKSHYFSTSIMLINKSQ